MSDARAHVSSIDSIRTFKAAVLTFAEEVGNALHEVNSDVARTLVWLEKDQKAHWERQVRIRSELVARAKSELYRKQMTSSSKEGKPSTVDEVRALKKAEARLDESHQKIRAIKRWSTQMQREMIVYRGQSASLAGAVHRDLPQAIMVLDKIVDNLESYLAMAPPDLRLAMGAPESADVSPTPSAARAGGGEAPEQIETKPSDDTGFEDVNR